MLSIQLWSDFHHINGRRRTGHNTTDNEGLNVLPLCAIAWREIFVCQALVLGFLGVKWRIIQSGVRSHHAKATTTSYILYCFVCRGWWGRHSWIHTVKILNTNRQCFSTENHAGHCVSERERPVYSWIERKILQQTVNRGVKGSVRIKYSVNAIFIFQIFFICWIVIQAHIHIRMHLLTTQKEKFNSAENNLVCALANNITG